LDPIFIIPARDDFQRVAGDLQQAGVRIEADLTRRINMKDVDCVASPYVRAFLGQDEDGFPTTVPCREGAQAGEDAPPFGPARRVHAQLIAYVQGKAKGVAHKTRG